MAYDDTSKSFDPFELFAAFLLGFGALGGAWAAYQGDLWGGEETAAYGQAATQATRASTVFNVGVTQLVRDLGLDLDAKKLIAEGVFSQDPAVQTRCFGIAGYLYTRQLSEEGYAAIGFPEQYRVTPERREPPEMPKEVLLEHVDAELGENDAYIEAVLGDGTAAFAEADGSFALGRWEGEIGDRFGLNGVLFTVALFLSGVALVFKSKVRWLFGVLGLLMVSAATFHLITQSWVKVWIDVPDPPAAAEQAPPQQQQPAPPAAEPAAPLAAPDQPAPPPATP